MSPKKRGRPRKSHNDSDDIPARLPASVAEMSTRNTTRGKGRGNTPSNQNLVPEVFQEMLADAIPIHSHVVERPLKKRKTGQREVALLANDARNSDHPHSSLEHDEDDLEFEDVLDLSKDGVAQEEFSSDEDNQPQKELQTTYRDSSEESEASNDWGAINFDTLPDEPSGDLELTLTSKVVPQRRNAIPRRKVVTKEDRALRLQIHKLHVLCLLSYMDRRNEWCNDYDVQKALKPLLSKKMLAYLKPSSDLSQFGRAESLKRGLADVSRMWRAKFTVTERGMKRSLWAEDEKDLENFKPPSDADRCLDKSDFRAASKTLKGSRDLGTQLYCALLRSAGVEVRLISSLQPLPYTVGGPAFQKNSTPLVQPKTPEASDEEEAVDIRGLKSPFGNNNGGPSSGSTPFTARQRLGHPNAADYHLPDISKPAPPQPKPKVNKIHESPYPVLWVEVLDDAHQKWIPVDPLVTESVGRPREFEPPASDRENSMSYVIAFEEEGTARDVTRRYTKAFNAKTRKTRVECTSGGEKWWKRTMRAYSRGWLSDVDQIEDVELAAAEAKEPMPKNITDFKDHPVYALERHLRRNEVLVSDKAIGKVAAGRDPAVPGQKKLENIYRRRDVRSVRSADAWYRIGREIKMGEIPIKTVEAKRKPTDDDLGDDLEERAGTNLYTEEQTELYEAPPVVNGRIPRNSYGNLDIFVPTMVPKGGIHIPYDEASRAARILGIDYADALTGFEFRGRHGTAVLKGVVVAIEYREAVEAVIEGFRDERAQAEADQKSLNALRLWKRFLISLRIKERVDGYEVEGEEPDRPVNEDADMEESDEYIDDSDTGGGFFAE